MNSEEPKALSISSKSVAGGLATLVGVGIYHLTSRLGSLDVDAGAPKEVHFTANGVGNVFDASETEMGGAFLQNPGNYIGHCKYNLETIDLAEGVMRLVLSSSDGKTKIGAFYGDSEGFGEALTKGSGTLSVYPSSYQNEVKFLGNTDITTIRFEFSADYIVTEGQTFEGMSEESIDDKPNQIVIDFKSGREGSEACADFYTSAVGGDETHMIHTDGGSHTPADLNFAFKGTLTINGDAFDVCIGQGHHGARNNWHLDSVNLTADDDGKNGDLGGYRLEQDGGNTFKVSLVK